MSIQSRKPERDSLVVSLFHELKSTRLVVEKTGIPLKTIHYVLHKCGVPTPRVGMRHNPHAACDRNAEKVLNMCEEGCSLSEIAREVGTVGREVKKFLRRHGVTKDFPTTKTGEKHYAWKGRTVDKDGYVLLHVKGHPNARKHTNYIFEHRLVMEAFLGRYLLPAEVVHHINGVKHDNRIENLQLFPDNGSHLAVDLKGRCPKWSTEGWARIQRSNNRRRLLAQKPTLEGKVSDDLPCI